MIKRISAFIVTLALSNPAFAKTEAEFEQYIGKLKVEAVEKGYSAELIELAFSTVKFKKKVIAQDKNQPEIVETLETYLPKRVPDWKVEKARSLYKENKELLDKIEKQFGVQGRFIVALWGLESNFGRVQGSYPVISALVTLAFDGRREEMYKNQLWAALDILKEGHIDLEHFKGSWAGAMGQTQFMPTSFNSYAVDFNGDGKKDIWTTKEDAFASIANYLSQVGWNDSLTWGRQVKLPKDFEKSFIVKRGTKNRKEWLAAWESSERTLQDWHELGVKRFDGTDLPKLDLKAALVMPDDENGRMYLAYDNYKALMHWNRSYYFATSVGYLSDRIGYPKL